MSNKWLSGRHHRAASSLMWESPGLGFVMKKVAYHSMAVPLRDNKRISSGTECRHSKLLTIETRSARIDFNFEKLSDAPCCIRPTRALADEWKLENDKRQSSEKKEKTVRLSPMTIKLLTNAQRSEKTATSTEKSIEAGLEFEITKLQCFVASNDRAF